MDTDVVNTWIGIARDVLIVAIGAFMEVHEIYAPVPNYLLVGAGLTLLGVPAAVRADSARRNKKEGNQGESGGIDERWTHLP